MNAVSIISAIMLIAICFVLVGVIEYKDRQNKRKEDLLWHNVELANGLVTRMHLIDYEIWGGDTFRLFIDSFPGSRPYMLWTARAAEIRIMRRPHPEYANSSACVSVMSYVSVSQGKQLQFTHFPLSDEMLEDDGEFLSFYRRMAEQSKEDA